MSISTIVSAKPCKQIGTAIFTWSCGCQTYELAETFNGRHECKRNAAEDAEADCECIQINADLNDASHCPVHGPDAPSPERTTAPMTDEGCPF